MKKRKVNLVSKVGGTDYYAKEWERKNQDDERVMINKKSKS